MTSDQGDLSIPYPNDRRWTGKDWRRPIRVRVRRFGWWLYHYRRKGHPVIHHRCRQMRAASWLLAVTEDRAFVVRRQRGRGKAVVGWLLGRHHDIDAYDAWKMTREAARH